MAATQAKKKPPPKPPTPAPLPIANAPVNAGTTATTTAAPAPAVSCPPIFVDPVQWLACQAAKGIIGQNSTLADWILDPVDALERLGLVIFGALLILMGILIMAIGPARSALGASAGISRDVRTAGRLVGAGTASGPTEEQKAERGRRIELAERNVVLGERKQEFREARERRIAMGRHKKFEPNPHPAHN